MLDLPNGRQSSWDEAFPSICGAVPPPRRYCVSCRASTGIASRKAPASVSSTTPGRWRRKQIASAIVSAADNPWNSCRANRPSAPAAPPPTRPSAPRPPPPNTVPSCYPCAPVRVPGGPEPIVLHRDAVSGGGYFMIGTIISADMDLIGQLQPNTPVRFVKVEMDQALAARKVRAELLAQIRSSLKSLP